MTETQRLALALTYYEQIGPEGVADLLAVEPEEVGRLLVLFSQPSRSAWMREERNFEADRRSAA